MAEAGIGGTGRALAVLAVVTVLAGCTGGGDGTAGGADGAIGGGGVVGGAAEPGLQPQPWMDPCNATDAFAFAGEATLAEIGLGDRMMGPDATRRGFIWVTRDPVSIIGPVPIGGPRGQEEASRHVCVEWPDGSGMSMSLENDWQPPGIGFEDAATSSEGEGELPVPLLVLTLSAVLLVGTSYVAFRKRPEPGAGG